MNRSAWTCFALLVPLSLQAQTWSILPGGAAGFTFPYSTTGTFACNPQGGRMTGGSCEANGNRMTIGTQTGVLDFAFHNVSTVFTATQKAQLAPIGQLDITFSGGGPFLFPLSGSGPLFELFIHISLWEPLDFNDAKGYGFIAGNMGIGYISTGTGMLTHNCCGWLNDGFDLGIDPSPPPFRYNELQFFDLNHPDILPEDASLDLTAEVRVDPEPASMLLMATGLVGIVGIGRRRKVPGHSSHA